MKIALPGGYTIIEVLLVLGISSAMLAAAIGIFSNQRRQTSFSQAVYDLRSELLSMANDVSSQSVPGLQSYSCTPKLINSVMRPTLAAGGSTGQDCVYIGQVIAVSAGSTTIYSYPVFGLRTVYDASQQDTGQTPSTPAEAHAEVAVNDTGDVIDALRTDYVLLNGLQISSAKLNGTESDLLSLYSNLQSNNTSGDEIDVAAFPATGDQSNPDAQAKECVESSGSCTSAAVAAKNISWNLCVALDSLRAQINVRGTPTGIVTNLNMNGCS